MQTLHRKKRGLTAVILAVVLLIALPPLHAQQTDPIRPALDTALNALRAQLNQTIPYVQWYTWEESTFDQGIGSCAPSQAQPLVFFGWSFIFMLYDNTQHEVRVSFNLQYVTVCDQPSIAASPPTSATATTIAAAPAPQVAMTPPLSIDPWALAIQDSAARLIVVDLSDQRIYALQHGLVIRSVAVSTGRPGMETPLGDFQIYQFRSVRDMPGAEDVPWVMYFYPNFAIHGAYWHNDFGRPVSHGCVNLPVAEAQWFYDFAGLGTPVHIQP